MTLKYNIYKKLFVLSKWNLITQCYAILLKVRIYSFESYLNRKQAGVYFILTITRFDIMCSTVHSVVLCLHPFVSSATSFNNILMLHLRLLSNWIGRNGLKYVGFEVFTAVVMKSIIFWDVTQQTTRRHIQEDYTLRSQACLALTYIIKIFLYNSLYYAKVWKQT
jgi:uncharacterized membrane protein (DUF441 family)